MRDLPNLAWGPRGSARPKKITNCEKVTVRYTAGRSPAVRLWFGAAFGLAFCPFGKAAKQGILLAVNELTFLYDDSDIFAVYKPPGVHSVRLPEGGGASVADALARHDPTLVNASHHPGDCGLIQRLDRETSGVLLGAKNREAWDRLFADLLSGAIKKTYVALTQGELRERITFSSYIGTPHRGAKKVKVYEKEPAKSARALAGTTVFSPLTRPCPAGMSLVIAQASPARRHQVRAHAAFLNYPLVGDTLYGATSSLAGITRSAREFFLHASEARFIHPRSGAEVVVVSDYEAELSLSGVSV